MHFLSKVPFYQQNGGKKLLLFFHISLIVSLTNKNERPCQGNVTTNDKGAIYLGTIFTEMDDKNGK